MKLITTVLFIGLVGFAGCKSPAGDSDLKITNGKVATDKDHPAVIQIATIISSATSGSCTGTFVSDSTVLTAAHCVTDRGRLNTNIRLGGRQGQKALKVFAHQSYLRGESTQNDVAIVVFKKDTSKHMYNIKRETPAVNSEITIVGFGNNDHLNQRGAGTKRVGNNKLRSNRSGVLSFYGEFNSNDGGNGVNAATSQGDSGGPMLVGGEIAGVVSSGRMDGSNKRSYYPDLNTESNREFLKSTLKEGANIPSIEDRPAADTDLFVAIGKKTNDTEESYQLFFGAKKEVSSIRFCQAVDGKPSLCPDGSPELTSSKLEFEVLARKVFASDSSFLISEDKSISIVALDAQGQLVSTATIRFNQ